MRMGSNSLLNHKRVFYLILVPYIFLIKLSLPLWDCWTLYFFLLLLIFKISYNKEESWAPLKSEKKSKRKGPLLPPERRANSKRSSYWTGNTSSVSSQERKAASPLIGIAPSSSAPSSATRNSTSLADTMKKQENGSQISFRSTTGATSKTWLPRFTPADTTHSVEWLQCLSPSEAQESRTSSRPPKGT